MQVHGFVQPLLALPRVVKRAIAIMVDVALCAVAVWLALFLRLGEWVPLSQGVWPAVVISIVLAIPIFVSFGLYRAVFRFVSGEALGAIAAATAVYGLIYATVCTAVGISGVPRTVGVIQPILLLLFVAASRVFARYWLGEAYRRNFRKNRKKAVLIYGAGRAGRQLAGALAGSTDRKVVGFIDDNPDLQGSVIDGIRIWGATSIADFLDSKDVEEVYLAIPSATRRRRNEILSITSELGVPVRTLPGLLDLASGSVTVSDLRALEIEDLLGRDPVPPDQALLESSIRGRIVLVTGAGGSIGSELCRQLLHFQPQKLLLVETSEFALFTIHSELSRVEGAQVEIIPILSSACDVQRMRQIFALWRPDTVYHAAAYKHVPLVEHNLAEGVRNNVFGTWLCARLADEFGAHDFTLISTDKAVRPTNMMGATKRLSEMALQALAASGSGTCFSMVRFGNVLGSSGSVVPLFRQQIAAGGPITVTHRDITRFFMTIPEAAQLVLQASAMAQGGEVFVLDMGDPITIDHLARRMVELSGLHVKDEQSPDGDIEIVYTGLRPGEKLYEELLIGDNPTATAHPRIMMASERFLPLDEVSERIAGLERAVVSNDVGKLRSIMATVVEDYRRSPDVVDWLAIRDAEVEAGSIGRRAAKQFL